MDNQPIVLECLLNAPASLVWKVITEKHGMKKWYNTDNQHNSQVIIMKKTST